ncbi:MAG: PhoX family phosphatase [Gammaproteobacteria bacterium AqS3]|nr:PhoX family phosphatase [Gammaproteobacteria bacterium AqS3]
MIERRDFLAGASALGLAGLLAGLGAPGLAAGQGRTGSRGGALSELFRPVSANTRDTVTVPRGYDWEVLVRWGDPLWSDAAQFDPRAGLPDAEAQLRCFGDQCDGMKLFSGAGGEVVLAINHEFYHPAGVYAATGGEPGSGADIRRGMLAMGVSVVEIARRGRSWRVVPDSRHSRRITPETPMDISGPLRGHALLRTEADPEGARSLGTVNNCGSGRTPWGTYLTCEENFDGFFSESASGRLTPEQLRYGAGANDWGFRWARIDERFDVDRHPNEANRLGYVVEIDPLDADSVPRKLTALGRLKHENAEVVIARNGRLVAYMGDDERGEYLYRYVSDGVYDPGAGAANRALLDAGALYAAKFSDDGSGEWLALTPETTGMDRAALCVHTRLGASKVSATTMDRPEWVAAHPDGDQVLCCLTNNKNRGRSDKRNRGGDAMPVNGPNPRTENHYGQIVRWRPAGGDHTAPGFAWDLFAVAGNPEVHWDDYAGSEHITGRNMFNSPDGLAFDRQGRLWIGTDGATSDEGDFKGMGNNQVLVGDVRTGEIQRFLTGPKGAEITGMEWSPDGRTMFIGIQHPEGRFPDGRGSIPRSSVISVWRKDGGVIG